MVRCLVVLSAIEIVCGIANVDVLEKFAMCYSPRKPLLD